MTASPETSPAAFAATAPGHDRHVKLTISGKLGYHSWRAVRDAREQAQRQRLPLRIDMAACHETDLAGVSALLIARERLGAFAIGGCNARLRFYFKHLGLCRDCASSCHHA